MRTSNGLLLLCALVTLTGCQSLQFDNSSTRNAEVAWQAMHVVDTLQTVTIARSPECLYEKNPLAAMLYGSKHPSVGRVLTINSSMALLHWRTGAWLDRGAERALANDSDNIGLWYVARGGYYVLSFLGTGSAVVGNFQLGVKPASKVRCAP
jgi:hypothetical protein